MIFISRLKMVFYFFNNYIYYELLLILVKLLTWL
jgi:hypothetical protein